MQVLAVLLLAVLALCEGFSLGTRGSTSHALKMSADVVDRLVVKVANSKLLTKVRAQRDCLRVASDVLTHRFPLFFQL